ncbi:hypothetical protein G5C64_16760 [Vibrio diabolicus]|uniref:relaxase/mobilization nuclease domain-containing protein n=1 Tax=Vibrio diabolicus TaxID=50719 RepID=UPI002151E59F|nr:hypothetical protein [Vibrio diabolicus]MCE3220475.1 hypothetical protein [Vibrio diabolicus]
MIFRILHEGGSKSELRSIVRYNSKNKKGLNNENNPRLIGVESNCGFCSDVQDEDDYKQLVENFIMTVETNSNLSKNKKQTKLYEHTLISFSKDDDNLGLEELQKLALEACGIYDKNFQDTPYMLWPQRDSGKLHFHIVRGFHDENGKYHRQYRSGKKIESAAQKLEKKYKLTLTGKNNPDNWFMIDGKKVYIPQHKKEKLKFAKNKNKEFSNEIGLQNKKLNKNKLKKKIANESIESIRLDTINISDEVKNSKKENNSIISTLEDENKNLGFFSKLLTNTKEVNDLEINSLKSKNRELNKEFTEHKDSNDESIQIKESEVEQLDFDTDDVLTEQKKVMSDRKLFNSTYNDIDSLKSKINSLYRECNQSIEFLEKLNESGIQITYTKRKNGLGGITFQSNDLSISGGKVNSQLTFGKLKKNNPKLLALITGEENYGVEASNTPVPEIFKIESINKFYKQSTLKTGETYIYFNKKDNKKYPHNFNLKVSQDKSRITFSNSSNPHDIRLGFKTAKKLGWTSGTSNSKQLVLNAMKVIYQDNPNDLFFFTTKVPSLKIEELKNATNNDTLSDKNLIELYDSSIVPETEKDNLKVYLKEQFEDKGYDSEKILESLEKGISLKEVLEDDKYKGSSGNTTNKMTTPSNSNTKKNNTKQTLKQSRHTSKLKYRP